MRNFRRVTAASVVLALVVCLAWAAETPGKRVFRTPQPPAAAQLGDIWVNPKDGGEMVYVPAGEFIMGGHFSNAKPQRKVYLDGYWIDKCEVTVAQYRNFCQQTGRDMPKAPPWGTVAGPPRSPGRFGVQLCGAAGCVVCRGRSSMSSGTLGC